MQKTFYGNYAAIPTPFDKDGNVLYSSLKTIIDRIVAEGMQGILVCGSTGEYVLLSNEKRKETIRMVCEIVDGRCKVMAGCGCHNQEETIDMLHYAESVGVDFALVVTPYYMQTNEQGIYEYYKACGEAMTKMKLLVYNYPEATAVRMSPEFIKKLAVEIPNVVGIKDTDHLEHTSKLVGETEGLDFGIVNGYEHLVMGSLTSGADGTIGIIHALAPKEMQGIYNAIQNNDVKTAIEINNKMRYLYTLMEKEPCPSPIKAALELMGIECGVPTRPMLPATEGLIEELKIEMKKIGLL